MRNATEVKSEETATEDSAEQGLEKGKEYEVAYEPVACLHQHRHICLSKILRQERSVCHSCCDYKPSPPNHHIRYLKYRTLYNSGTTCAVMRQVELAKPLGLRFARGSDGGAYVARSDPNLGNTDSNVQVQICCEHQLIFSQDGCIDLQCMTASCFLCIRSCHCHIRTHSLHMDQSGKCPVTCFF